MRNSGKLPADKGGKVKPLLQPGDTQWRLHIERKVTGVTKRTQMARGSAVNPVPLSRTNRLGSLNAGDIRKSEEVNAAAEEKGADGGDGGGADEDGMLSPITISASAGIAMPALLMPGVPVIVNTADERFTNTEGVVVGFDDAKQKYRVDIQVNSW